MSNEARSSEKLSLSDLIDLIEQNEGPAGLNLVRANLYGADLSAEAVDREIKRRGLALEQGIPIWVSQFVLARSILGLNLKGVILDLADLRLANLRGVDLTQAKLRGARLSDVCLEHATLYRANLSGARLWRTDLRQARLGLANFHGASIYRAELEGAIFSKAQMDKAHLLRLDFSAAKVQRDSFSGRLRQEYPGYMEFIAKDSPDIPDSQKIEIGSIPLRHAQEIYIGLKNSFSAQGRYFDASWAFFHERQLERCMRAPIRVAQYYGQHLEKAPPFAKAWFYLCQFFVWLGFWAAELSCGYGERPWRAFGMSSIIIFSFTMLYSLSGGINIQGGRVSYWDYLLYSISAFATINFQRYVVTNPLAEALTSLEALSGIAIVALLMFAFGNRMSRT
jgi:uncharacterized protein YjbI with pentapeptide repeats